MSLKESWKEKEKQIFKKEFEKGEDNRVIVDMIVKDDSDFLSVFSTSEQPVISSSVAEFLETSTQSLMPNEAILLKIKSNCIDDNEKVIYDHAIRQYYSERYVTNQRELKLYNLASLVLLIVGVIVLGISLFVQNHFESMIWSEVIDIFAWVILWEVADIKIFRTRELKRNRHRFFSFITMKIIYEELKEHE